MVMPLSEFDPQSRARIEELAAREYPPPRWLVFYDGPDCFRPLAATMSRAFYEWHLRRGRDVRLRPLREPIALRLRLAVIRRDGLTCGLCGGAVPRDDVHIDHIRPVSLGGRSLLPNLQVAHSVCNMRKGNRV